METIGWFAEPLMTGNYPEHVKKVFEELLPQFNSSESDLLVGSADFLAVDHYTTYLVCCFSCSCFEILYFLLNEAASCKLQAATVNYNL